MSDKIEYDTILSLARKSNFKKIMIIRDSWNTGSWCIVNSIEIKPDGEHCKPYGYIKMQMGIVLMVIFQLIIHILGN